MAFRKLNVIGNIPAGSPCPFENHCMVRHHNACHHHGKDHEVDHSCHMARQIDWTPTPNESGD